MNKVNISVITVVLNDVKNIEKTILSVVNQKSSNFEYLIIDGGSNDGTIEVIQKYKDKINLIISEPDKGLYDAMNKGLKFARGEWIFYLNSSDEFLQNTVLSCVEKSLSKENDVVHFNCKVENSKGKEVYVRQYPADISEIKRWPCIQHQSSFTKRKEMIKLKGFDLKYSILSDYDLFLRLYKSSKKFKFFKDIYISKYNSEGVSSDTKNIKILQRELRIIQKKHLGFFSISMQLQLTVKSFFQILPFSYHLGSFVRRLLFAKR